MFGNQQRKLRKNIEETGKILIFAASNLKFGYPGKFPAGEQDHIDTTPFLKVASKGWLLSFIEAAESG